MYSHISGNSVIRTTDITVFLTIFCTDLSPLFNESGSTIPKIILYAKTNSITMPIIVYILLDIIPIFSAVNTSTLLTTSNN